MVEHAAWRPAFRAMCPEPGPCDLFVVILLNGKHISFHPITEYQKWRIAAEQLVAEHQCQVKVLPMGADELMNYLRIPCAEPQPIEDMDPEFRAQAVQNCLDCLQDGVEPRYREQALNLLRVMGVLNA